MNIVEVINNITKFSSSIWQVHPFREGNTRTTALFIEKYLISLGYNVDNSLFKDKSVYFRNALVRSNYFNNYLNLKEDKTFLVKFYENLPVPADTDLHSLCRKNCRAYEVPTSVPRLSPHRQRKIPFCCGMQKTSGLS